MLELGGRLGRHPLVGRALLRLVLRLVLGGLLLLLTITLLGFGPLAILVLLILLVVAILASWRALLLLWNG